MIRIGDMLPEMGFDIYHNDDFKKVNFSDFRGKWLVVLFYPADFTFVCPTELEEAAETYDRFKSQNAEILSFSTDTKFAHKAWHDTSSAIKKISYPMGADPTGKVCREFGTYIESGGDAGLSLRATFIISPDGVVKSMDIHDNSIGRSAEEILRKLEASVYVSGHEGEVCPAGWRPGKKTLKPGVDLVGKI
jgi:NADH-dependent peroxiredoxin subunit C